MSANENYGFTTGQDTSRPMTMPPTRHKMNRNIVPVDLTPLFGGGSRSSELLGQFFALVDEIKAHSVVTIKDRLTKADADHEIARVKARELKERLGKHNGQELLYKNDELRAEGENQRAWQRLGALKNTNAPDPRNFPSKAEIARWEADCAEAKGKADAAQEAHVRASQAYQNWFYEWQQIKAEFEQAAQHEAELRAQRDALRASLADLEAEANAAA